jgi:hypothetical protein
VPRESGGRGAALSIVAVSMALLGSMIVTFGLVGRNETFIAPGVRDTMQAGSAAEAGATRGRLLLAERLGQDLPREVAASGQVAMIGALRGVYSTATGAAQLIVDKARPPSGGPTFVLCTTVTGGCPEPGSSAVGAIPDSQQVTIALDGTSGSGLHYTTRIIVGSHPARPPAIAGDGTSALFTYVWRIESTGTSGRGPEQSVIHDSAVPTNPAGSFTIAFSGGAPRGLAPPGLPTLPGFTAATSLDIGSFSSRMARF